MKPFIATKKTIDIRESIGKISASYIIPYPPGIPPYMSWGGRDYRRITPLYLQLMDIGIEIVGLIGYNKEKILVID